MKAEILEPSGCCQGVNRAIDLAINARKKYQDQKIYILGMLVHNEVVNDELRKLGILFLDAKNAISEINKINDGVIIFTAHGHNEELDKLAQKKGLKIIDTTCGYVKANHTFIKKTLIDGKQVIFVGKSAHPETEGILSISNDILLYDIHNGFQYEKVTSTPTVVFQTTLSILEIEDIKKDILNHFPNAIFAKSVCRATFLRQSSLKNINPRSDLILVVGSHTSSNTTKLYEIAKQLYPNKAIMQIKTVSDISNCSISKYSYATIIGGASTPLKVLKEIENYLMTFGINS